MKEHLLPVLSDLYDLEGFEILLIPAHDGGRNVVYTCEREGSEGKILRIVFSGDRSREDLLAEVEFVKYLYEHGASVPDVICSLKGNLMEEIMIDDHTYTISLFQKAKGKKLAENQYRYRDGVPLSEYFYNCGKELGKLHQLSKGFSPVHRRYSFFDKYNAEYIDHLIPDALVELKGKMLDILNTLAGLDKSNESYGLVHFDYNDGNYSIDFDTGQITVYDFDNCCYCWYMFDLAGLWIQGMGWVQFESDVAKRKQFMNDYFDTVLDGYRSETSIEEGTLAQLPFFIQVSIMENIIDIFEGMRASGEKDPEDDEELIYLTRCLVEDIPYKGFFHDIYSSN